MQKDLELGKKIEKYIEADKWTDARAVIVGALRKYPKDHWLLTRLALTYYEQEKYKDALKFSKKAFSISPDCPLVLWDYAGVLDALCMHKDAILIYKKITSKKVEVLAYGDCGEGLRSAKSLVNDSFYRIAQCYRKIGSKVNADKFYKKYLDGRKNKVVSAYKLSAVKKDWVSD